MKGLKYRSEFKQNIIDNIKVYANTGELEVLAWKWVGVGIIGGVRIYTKNKPTSNLMDYVREEQLQSLMKRERRIIEDRRF